MSALTEFKLKLLHEFRANLLDPKKDQLTLPLLQKCVSDNYKSVTSVGANLVNPLGQLIGTFAGIEDVDVLDAARDQVVAMIDGSIASLAGELVRPTGNVRNERGRQLGRPYFVGCDFRFLRASNFTPKRPISLSSS
jgi:hypothetical protein